MTKITKESLTAKIKRLESLGNAEFGLGKTLNEEFQLEAYRMLLAGMEQEPKSKAAVATLEGHGFTWCGGEQWKPPLGLPPAFVSSDRAELQQYRKADACGKIRAAHAEWSLATFGNVGPVGPLKHLSKEALEAAAEPGDLSEWADMQFLLWDAQSRAGITDDQITQAMVDKLAVNMARQWPAPKDGEPRYHVKQVAELQSEPVSQPYKLDGWVKCSERMPEDDSVVLVADERGIVWCAEVEGGQIYPDEFPNVRGFGCAEAICWMPLPAAPQQEQSNG